MKIFTLPLPARFNETQIREAFPELTLLFSEGSTRNPPDDPLGLDVEKFPTIINPSILTIETEGDEVDLTSLQNFLAEHNPDKTDREALEESRKQEEIQQLTVLIKEVLKEEEVKDAITAIVSDQETSK
jgi:hypothetical protein